jgi:hypothetical protein
MRGSQPFASRRKEDRYVGESGEQRLLLRRIAT